MTETTNATFRQQIKDDIDLIQEKVYWDQNAKKEEYAFNYWVLSKIYNLDEEIAISQITEYNDKGVDCFVHHPETKDLYIIQNKYYGENTPLDRKDVSDFLSTPLTHLGKNTYKKSPELQKIYNNAIKDGEYKIFFHFYITNDKRTNEIMQKMKDFNNSQKGGVIADIFYLSDIKEKYYGKTYEEKCSLNYELSINDKDFALNIPSYEDGIEDMRQAFYVRVKIKDIYDLYCNAEKKKYSLFEDNIREYLGGTGGINKNIIETLKDIKERRKFFYYNNGITIICKDADASSVGIKLTDPQIVNGCQTVSSIAKVLENADIDEFEEVHVMTKILVVEKEKKDSTFYKDIVQYTNSQNSINENVFGATTKQSPFPAIKEEIEARGFLLCVKPSDRNTFKEKYSDSRKKGELLHLAKKTSKDFYPIKGVLDVHINIEHLLQVIGAFSEDAYFAYTKKALLLRRGSKEYTDFSLTVHDRFTTKQMVNLIIFYKRAERDKRKSDDNRTPISYYLLNFLGFYLNEEDVDLKSFLEKVTIEQLEIIYEQFRTLSKDYYEKNLVKNKADYNKMLKQKVDNDIMHEVLRLHFEGFEKHNREGYLEFEEMISGFKK